MTENAPREMEKRMTFEKNMEGLARKRRLKDGAFKERKGREGGRKEGRKEDSEGNVNNE